MLGDLFTLKERAQVQGLFSAVWGLSSVGGPLVGRIPGRSPGLAVGVSWCAYRLPLAAIVMLVFFVSEPKVERKVAPIDWAGAVLLTSGMSTLLWVVLDGSRQGFVTDLVALGVSAGLLVLFVFRERMAADPILPLDSDDSADDCGVTGGQLSGRRHPVWARYLRAAVCARRARRRRDLGRPLRSCRSSWRGRSAWPWQPGPWFTSDFAAGG